MTRRRDLAAALAAIAVALAARPAQALSFQEAPESVDRLWRARCEGAESHVAVVRRLYAELRAEAGEERARELLRTLPCPTCGCSLAAVLDQAER